MGFSVHRLAGDEESVWVLDEHGFAVVRIDPETNQLQDRIPIDFVGANLAAILTGRATTTSCNSALRFFLLGIGPLLLNGWVFLRWEFARLLAHGPYRVNEPLFRFHRFTRLLIRSIEKIYSTLRAIPTYKLPQSVIY